MPLIALSHLFSPRPSPDRVYPSPSPWLVAALGLLITFSVVAFGAVEDWSSATFEAGVLLLAAAVAWWRRDMIRWPATLGAPALFLLILIAAGLVQLLPLSLSTWKTLGDERGTLYERAAKADTLLHSDLYRTDPITGTVYPEKEPPAPAPPAPTWLPSTFTPGLTAQAVMALITAFVFLVLLDIFGRAPDLGPLRALALWVGLLGFGVGVVALVNYRETATKILGFRESAHAAQAFGPFVNENNGMGFVNIAMSLLYYLLWRRIRHTRHLQNRFGIVMLIAGLVLFHAAILAIRTSGAGSWTLLMLPVVALLHGLRSRPKLALGLAMGVGAALIVFATFAVAYRFTDLHGRIEVWSDALAQPHWLIGNGLQSFQERFQALLTMPPGRRAVWWMYPENEYLQLFFEAGLPGVVSAMLAIGYVAALGWRCLLAPGHSFLLVAPLWGEALHAVTDFHFHLWPVAITYLLLITLVQSSLLNSATAHRHNHGSHHRSGEAAGSPLGGLEAS